jgi:hypothetical protein
MAAISTIGTIFAGAGATNIKGLVTAINLGGISTAEIDVTGIGDTSKSYVMGTLEGGTIEVTVNVDNANAAVTLPTAGASTAAVYTLTFGTPSASNACPRFSFNAFVQNISVEAGIDAQVTATYTLRINGAITVSSVTS